MSKVHMCLTHAMPLPLRYLLFEVLWKDGKVDTSIGEEGATSPFASVKGSPSHGP